MATRVEEREPTALSGTSGKPSKNARLSANRRAKRPEPATRHEAEALFEPSRAYSPAHGGWLARMNQLGLLHPEGRPLTRAEAHTAILDALYPPDQAA